MVSVPTGGNTMRSLTKICHSAAWLLVLFAPISLMFASTPVRADQPAAVPERELLKGLVGIEVLVEPLNIEIEDLGLETMKLQSDIRQRLQKSGIKLLTERERLATSTAAMLAVRVDALHDRIGRYFYSIDLFLTQRVRLEGSRASEPSAVTWMKLGAIEIIADDNVKHLEDQVFRKIDQFIKDYQSVNPERRGSDQPKKH